MLALRKVIKSRVLGSYPALLLLTRDYYQETTTKSGLSSTYPDRLSTIHLTDGLTRLLRYALFRTYYNFEGVYCSD